MKFLIIILMFLIASGCTTLKTVELEPQQLHEQISTGNIIQVGDKVQVVTSDGMRHKFKVKAITENRIVGKDIDIPIMDIVALEIRIPDDEKTSLLVAGGITVAIVGALYLLESALESSFDGWDSDC